MQVQPQTFVMSLRICHTFFELLALLTDVDLAMLSTCVGLLPTRLYPVRQAKRQTPCQVQNELLLTG